MRKRTIGVTIFGIIFIISGLCSIFSSWIAYGRLSLLVLTREYLSFLKYSPLVIGPLVGGIIFIIIGIGIFKLKFWAWYLIIANEIIRILSLPNRGFILGWQAYDPLGLAVQIGLIAFILWFFMRPKIREQFLIAEERFRLKSWYAPLIVLLLIMTLAVPVFVLGYKVFNPAGRIQPFLVKKPQLIKLPEVDRASLEDRFKIREIFNLSFLVPEDFVLRRFEKKTGSLTLRDITDRNFIMVNDKPLLEPEHELRKIMRFENAYQFEEAVYSNNWGLVLLILRDIILPRTGDDTQIRRFDSSVVKGFIHYGYRKGEDRWAYIYSVYDKLNRGIGNIMLLLKGEDFSFDEALRMISSIKILKNGDAEEYYQKGLQLLDEGDSIDAQFAFARAYYLADFPEAGYMLAKTILMMNGKQLIDLIGAEGILKEVLMLKPDYPEAKELLSLVNREIEAIEKEESK